MRTAGKFCCIISNREKAASFLFLGGLHQDTSKVKAMAGEETEILFTPVDKVSLLIKGYPEWLDYIFRLYHKRFKE